MNRQPDNLTTCIMQACAPFALAAIVGLAVSGCGKSRADGEKTATAPISLSTAGWADSDDDGIPDAAELSSSDDRDSFRRWFAYIAEMQFYKLSDGWNEDQR